MEFESISLFPYELVYFYGSILSLNLLWGSDSLTTMVQFLTSSLEDVWGSQWLPLSEFFLLIHLEFMKHHFCWTFSRAAICRLNSITTKTALRTLCVLKMASQWPLL